MISSTDFLVYAATVLLMVFFARARKNKRIDNPRYPPSLPCLPIVGSLPFIHDFDDIPGFLMRKASELGPVFTLKFGSRVVAVLNNLEAIEEALAKNGSSFSGRESAYIDKYVLNPNQKGIATKNYDSEFRRFRKLTMSILRDFGFGTRSKMETLILTEVSELIDHIKKINGKAFDPIEMMIISLSNVPLHMLFGKRRSLEDGLNDIYVETTSMVEAATSALDLFPILRFFPPFNKQFLECQQHSAKLLGLIEKEIVEIMENKSVDCFVRRYIESQGEDYDHEQLVFTLRDLIAGSLETTPTAILWALINLTNNPRAAERIQKEIEAVVPRDRLPSSDDRERLPYTEATILEVLRHRTVGPLAVPHLTLHDTKVMGYFIPANTVVLPNLMSANMNPRDWPDAEIFRPERFLDQENKLIDKDRVISFSLGRRSCPGEELARHQLFLFISGLLQNFSLHTPEGIDSIKDKIKPGIATCPYPFKIRMIARDL